MRPGRIDVFVPDGGLVTQQQYYDNHTWGPSARGMESLSSLGGNLSY